MKKNIFSTVLILTLAIMSWSCREKNDLPLSNERAIIEIKTSNQIGNAVIAREVEECSAVVTLDIEKVTLSSVALDFILSPGAVISPASGSIVDFTLSGDSSFVYTVISESGIEREWTVFVKPFSNPIRGTWTISKYQFSWDDGFGWGNKGTAELYTKFAATSPGLDDTLIFGGIEGVLSSGAVWGYFERQNGPDDLYASYIYPLTDKDWSFKFGQVINGKGKWQLNPDKSIDFTDQAGTVTYKTIGVTSSDDTSIVLDLTPGPVKTGEINWDNYYGDNQNKFCCTVRLWYTLIRQE